ncbi:hypothetical protein F4781DRAFT_261827 [Annulohypoxylon bovei var. microspora]|nr:hypothetical protein F4781DRAFT_261827 [Annulohypoxylon bovei var. microspora]
MSSINIGNFASLSPDQQAQVLNGPALQPPPGVTSNFDHPPNGTVPSHIALAIFLALITFSLCGRIYVRFSTRQLFIGDYLLIMIYATNTVTFAFSYRVFSSPGAFVHQWDVRMSALTSFLWNVWITSNTQLFSLTFVKVVILLEWIRIFVPRGTRNFVFWTSHSLIWINLMFCIAIVVAYNLACTPHKYIWNKFISGNCDRANTGIENLMISVVSLVTDVLTFLIPQKAIWKLHLSTNRKSAISATFAAGILAVAAASARLAMAIIRGNSRDFTYNNTSLMLCGVAEITCAFLVVCIPTLPKAFKSIKRSKVMSSFCSWTRMEESQTSSRRDARKWPRSKHSQSNTSGGISVEVEEYRLYPATRLHTTSSIDLSTHEHLGSGILRTTHFEAREDYYPNVTVAEYPPQYGLNGIL